ncbi:MAG: YbaK/EbsC family protein [Nitrospirota bacterium]
MTTLAKLKLYLDRNNIPYEVILHAEVYTAQELAEALHTPGRELVKVVVVQADNRYIMAVLPAVRKIDLPALKTLLKAEKLSIVAEPELKTLFPETEVGAMPPLGNLYNMDVYADGSLEADEYITFNAGTHYEAIRMRYNDFARLVTPVIGTFTVHI